MDYKEAGVDNEAKKEASRLLFEAAQRTWENRRGILGEVITPNETFSGVRFTRLTNFTGILGACSDGIGTKVEATERLNDGFYLTPNDLVAMVCDDAARDGAEPVLFASVIDFSKLSLEIAKQLASGLVSAAKQAKVAVINGETAELGSRVAGYGSNGFLDHLVLGYIGLNLRDDNVKSIKALANYLVETDDTKKQAALAEMAEPEQKFVQQLEKMRRSNYNWNATCVWFAKEGRLINPRGILPKQLVIAVRERGFRSNGLSLARKILEQQYGSNWHDAHLEFAHRLNVPSTIYTRAIVALTGGYSSEPKANVTGIAHITGGGIPEKLGRLLSVERYGATLFDLFDPPESMSQIQQMGKVTDEEAYRTWNMGQGLLIMTREADKVFAVLRDHDLEVRVAGEITEQPGITLVSRGIYSKNKQLSFEVN